MASNPSWKELVEQLNNFKAEVPKLKNALNELDYEKESWFGKKEELSKKIREGIGKIKDNREKRDILTTEVKELKSKRDSINKEISLKLSEFNKLKREKAEIAASLGIKESPSKIKQDVEKLEFRIETEPMPFNKEQALMKRIKELKNLYEDAGMLNDISKKIKEFSGEIKKMTKEADEIHNLIQEKAQQSQMLHEDILKVSADVDEMKIGEENSFKKFSELKAKFNGFNAQLKEKLKAMNEIRNALDKISYDRKERKRAQQESFLKSKEDQVNEKIKRREKLTTDDLLVFQKRL